MAKYRAKIDIAPNTRKGDIVEFNEPLVDGLKNHFEEVSDDTEVTVDTGGIVTLEDNISREDLKKKADELGVDYASNIGTAKLLELVKAKMAEDAEQAGAQ